MMFRFLFLALVSACCRLSAGEADYLSEVRQLTFEGQRAGEGYFSADGSKMVFQSERQQDNPFYQIYLLDLTTGDERRLSPGMGKTTCAWIHPAGDRVLFASTHHDPQSQKLQEQEFSQRRLGTVRKYSWDYDENYDLWQSDLQGGSLRRLTQQRGYDAEASWSPDGKWLVFSSNRHAYEEPLSEADAQRIKLDKSYFLDLYLARADGSEVKRLTRSPGYDGGPFFSADSRRICWRRFTPKGDQAEVWSMSVDGSDQRQLTRLGAMSWAPYYHPSGRYLIFTTNLNGFANFELYMVDADGLRPPVRVTHTDGFDGLPVFTPDGANLSWTSGRTPGGQSQIFMAKWNHAQALKALGLAPAEVSKAAATAAGPDSRQLAAEISARDIKAHVEWLASDNLDGRLAGTEGERRAAKYISEVFASVGLQPYGDNEWLSAFPFTAGVELAEGNQLRWRGEELKLEVDWRPLTFSSSLDFAAAPVVFAGYGIETPEGALGDSGKAIEPYSSYAHLEVKDRWVMVLRYLPEGITPARRTELSPYASLRNKAMVARQRGARGLVVVSGPASKVVSQLVPLDFDASLAGSGLGAVSVTDAVAEKMLQGTGKSLAALQGELDKGGSMMGFECGDGQLQASVRIRQEKRTAHNVLGILPAGASPDPHRPAVIIGAHYDHLGSRAGGSSRASGEQRNKIHHGADDNASGVAGMLEIAHWLVEQKSTGALKLQRDVIFAAWSAEELGLLGSHHFTQQMAKAIGGDESTKLTPLFAACLNLDMIGRLRDSLVLQGVGSSPWWSKAIERRNVVVGLPVVIQKDAHLPTDSTSFFLRSVPVLNAFTGNHADYHLPTDTADKINVEGAARVSSLMGMILRDLAQSVEVPAFVAMEAPRNQGTRGGLRAYLGTIPDYAQGDVKGVKLSGVSALGPAAKAGVKGGDVIVGLGGKEVLNIYDYTAIMGALKVGQPTTLKVLRSGKVLELKVTPGSRD
jgi:Tol biopolymer transport system component